MLTNLDAVSAGDITALQVHLQGNELLSCLLPP
jgi:hypothetical protein